MNDSDFETGYRVATMEIQNGIASHVTAKDRGLFLESRSSRREWDTGYEACVCMYRLGYNVVKIGSVVSEQEFFITAITAVHSLLDGRTLLNTQPDPRKLVP